MCGIIGYIGKGNVKQTLLDGLELLEYRGYDSAGVALLNESGTLVRKTTGRVSLLKDLTSDLSASYTAGIGHTRWATHGGVSEVNAHPHASGDVTLVHNGIVENYKELSVEYGFAGSLQSETDTEVAAALVNHFYQETGHDPHRAIYEAVAHIKGTFAFAILFADRPEEIYCIRNVSPIIIAHMPEGSYLASDVTALGGEVDEYAVLPEMSVAVLSAAGIRVTDAKGVEASLRIMTIDWDTSPGSMEGFQYYMEKEMSEQPEAIRRTIAPHINRHGISFAEEGIADELFATSEEIVIIACGTAMHAGLIAQSLFQGLAGTRCSVYMASEFLYNEPVIDAKSLVIAISQSGETIDTLEALRYARRLKARTLSIVNVKGTSIAGAADRCIYTHAGPEIAVASTKAFTCQCAVLFLLAILTAHVKERISDAEYKKLIAELNAVPDFVADILADKDRIKPLAAPLVQAQHAFMIGRGLDYSILLEASLKLKEISYVHSEAYASGELKHGTIALIEEGTPVVALVTQSFLASKELSNIREVASRGASLILLHRKRLMADDLKEHALTYQLPDMDDRFMVFPAIVVCQWMAFYTATGKGFDVDKPRNLAKVVTVE